MSLSIGKDLCLDGTDGLQRKSSLNEGSSSVAAVALLHLDKAKSGVPSP